MSKTDQVSHVIRCTDWAWYKRRLQVKVEKLGFQEPIFFDFPEEPRHGDLLWGRVLFMRDELREVAPGILLGLGSMGATGGVANCAPFVFVRPPPPSES